LREVAALHVLQEEHVEAGLAERKGGFDEVLARNLTEDVVLVGDVLDLFAVQALVDFYDFHRVPVIRQ
jgi:hypothetical protein